MSKGNLRIKPSTNRPAPIGKCRANLSKQVDQIVEKEFSNNKLSNKIEEIDPEINFKLNSFNIAIGPQGASKTVSVLKELMKLQKVYQVSNGTAWFEKETIY